MELHLVTKRCELTPGAEKALERHLERLRRRLRHFPPDLLHLELTVPWWRKSFPTLRRVLERELLSPCPPGRSNTCPSGKRRRCWA